MVSLVRVDNTIGLHWYTVTIQSIIPPTKIGGREIDKYLRTELAYLNLFIRSRKSRHTQDMTSAVMYNPMS